MVAVMGHWKARRPSLGDSSSRAFRRDMMLAARSSSTMVMMAEFSLGQAWLPRCGSPLLLPRPLTMGQEVKPRQLLRSSISTMRW